MRISSMLQWGAPYQPSQTPLAAPCPHRTPKAARDHNQGHTQGHNKYTPFRSTASLHRSPRHYRLPRVPAAARGRLPDPRPGHSRPRAGWRLLANRRAWMDSALDPRPQLSRDPVWQQLAISPAPLRVGRIDRHRWRIAPQIEGTRAQGSQLRGAQTGIGGHGI